MARIQADRISRRRQIIRPRCRKNGMDQLNLNFTAATLVVARIEHVTAKPFIEKWHYSRSCPTGQNWFFGAFVNGELYAVADYGIGAIWMAVLRWRR